MIKTLRERVQTIRRLAISMNWKKIKVDDRINLVLIIAECEGIELDYAVKEELETGVKRENTFKERPWLDI